MKTDFSLIRNPHITEKVLTQKEADNKVVFKVDPSVNKIELKQAIERIFKVTVVKVATQNMKGKKKRFGVHFGRTADWKKAVVTLKEGDKIEYFEGA